MLFIHVFGLKIVMYALEKAGQNSVEAFRLICEIFHKL